MRAPDAHAQRRLDALPLWVELLLVAAFVALVAVAVVTVGWPELREDDRLPAQTTALSTP